MDKVLINHQLQAAPELQSGANNNDSLVTMHDDFTAKFNSITVSYNEHGVRSPSTFINIKGHELRDKLINTRMGEKDGAHFLRTALDTDSQGGCLSRSDNYCKKEAWLIPIDVDDATAPPKDVHDALKQANIAHIIVGSHSYYAEDLNRFRILLVSQLAYDKEQLAAITENVVELINCLLASGAINFASENTKYSQPWYLPSKPQGCEKENLYMEYTKGNLFPMRDKEPLPDINQACPPRDEKLIKGQLSAITAWNEQQCVTAVLQEYDYKRVLQTGHYTKWLSPTSKSKQAGVTEDTARNKIFSHHDDVLNIGYWLDSFDAMRLLKGLSINDAVKFASKNTKAPNGQSIDEFNKSAHKDHNHSRSNDWIEPIELIGASEPTPYPVNSLPEILRNAVSEVQKCLEAPLAIVAHSAISWATFAIQGRVVVKRDDQGIIAVYLNFLTVACSGERKTACDKLFGKSALEHQKKLEIIHGNEMKSYKANHKKWKLEGDRLNKQYLREKNHQSNKESLLIEMDHHHQKEPQPPQNWQIIYSDTTMEALLADLAAPGQQSVILHSTEAGNFFGGHSMSADNAMKSIAQLNQIWDGDAVTTNRKTGATHTGEKYGSTNAKAVCTSFLTQPTVFHNFMENSKGLLRTMGFLARQLFSWPESTIGTRMYKDVQEMLCLKKYQQRLDDIWSIPYKLDKQSKLDPEIMNLSQEAKDFWVEFYNSIEKELGKGGEYYEVQDIGSKIAEITLRLSAVFAYFENPNVREISKETMEQAARIMLYHLKEANRSYPAVGQSEEYANAMLLDKWLINKRVEKITKRELQQYAPNKIRKAKALEKALAVLIDCNRVKVTQNNVIELNPKLLKTKK